MTRKKREFLLDPLVLSELLDRGLVKIDITRTHLEETPTHIQLNLVGTIRPLTELNTFTEEFVDAMRRKQE